LGMKGKAAIGNPLLDRTRRLILNQGQAEQESKLPTLKFNGKEGETDTPRTWWDSRHGRPLTVYRVSLQELVLGGRTFRREIATEVEDKSGYWDRAAS